MEKMWLIFSLKRKFYWVEVNKSCVSIIPTKEDSKRMKNIVFFPHRKLMSIWISLFVYTVVSQNKRKFSECFAWDQSWYLVPPHATDIWLSDSIVQVSFELNHFGCQLDGWKKLLTCEAMLLRWRSADTRNSIGFRLVKLKTLAIMLYYTCTCIQSEMAMQVILNAKRMLKTIRKSLRGPLKSILYLNKLEKHTKIQYVHVHCTIFIVRSCSSIKAYMHEFETKIQLSPETIQCTTSSEHMREQSMKISTCGFVQYW